MKVYLVFYDDFSGVDEIFFTLEEAVLYKKWIGAIPDVVEKEVNEDLKNNGFVAKVKKN